MVQNERGLSQNLETWVLPNMDPETCVKLSWFKSTNMDFGADFTNLPVKVLGILSTLYMKIDINTQHSARKTINRYIMVA